VTVVRTRTMAPHPCGGRGTISSGRRGLSPPRTGSSWMQVTRLFASGRIAELLVKRGREAIYSCGTLGFPSGEEARSPTREREDSSRTTSTE
jgi:hypothetical protein